MKELQLGKGQASDKAQQAKKSKRSKKTKVQLGKKAYTKSQ